MTERLLPTPKASDARLPGGKRNSPGLAQMAALRALPIGGGMTDWGVYEPAIRRWEAVLNRLAPAPTEPNSNGNPRLTVAFDEFVMGFPEGWIADVNIPHGAKIKLCGNGVVPQQGAYALRRLLWMVDMTEEWK